MQIKDAFKFDTLWNNVLTITVCHRDPYMVKIIIIIIIIIIYYMINFSRAVILKKSRHFSFSCIVYSSNSMFGFVYEGFDKKSKIVWASNWFIQSMPPESNKVWLLSLQYCFGMSKEVVTLCFLFLSKQATKHITGGSDFSEKISQE